MHVCGLGEDTMLEEQQRILGKCNIFVASFVSESQDIIKLDLSKTLGSSMIATGTPKTSKPRSIDI